MPDRSQGRARGPTTLENPKLDALSQVSGLAGGSHTGSNSNGVTLGLRALPYNRTMFNVLFLCTGNLARSILAESLINDPRIGQGKFKGYSAGSHPKGEVHPLALETLRTAGFNAEGFRSKSWDEFAQADAPPLDFVFTVCDQAAAEPCPMWPGQPMTAHWGIPDPAAVDGTDDVKRRAFKEALLVLRRRIELFACLPARQARSAGTPEEDPRHRPGLIVTVFATPRQAHWRATLAPASGRKTLAGLRPPVARDEAGHVYRSNPCERVRECAGDGHGRIRKRRGGREPVHAHDSSPQTARPALGSANSPRSRPTARMSPRLR